MTRRSLLASLMALSLLCGGLGVAEATVHVNEGTGVTHEVYTTVETYSRELADAKLDLKADKTDVAKNTADIATNKGNITKLENDKLDKALASETYATKDALNDLKTVVNGKADATDVNNKLANKADASELDGKANKADVYSKTDADTTFATKTELNAKADTTALEAKADRTYVDQKFTEAGTNVDNKLEDYYNKAEVDGKITAEENARNNAITNAIGQERNDRTTAIDTAINREATARNQAINTAITQEVTDRNAAVANAKAELQAKITAEETARTNADTAFNTRLTTAEGKIGANETAIGELKAKDTELEGKITTLEGSGVKYDTAVKDKITLAGAGGTTITHLKDATLSDSSTDAVTGKQLNKTNENLAAEETARTNKDMELEGKINTLDGNVTTAQGDINDLKAKDIELEGRIHTNEGNIETNKNAIAATDKRTAGIARNDATNETTIENNVTVDNLGNVKAEGNVTAEGKLKGEGVDAGDGAITTTGAVNAGSLRVENASQLKGDVTMDKTLSVTGDTTLKGTKVDGKLTVTDEADLKNTTVGGTLGVTGEAIFKDKVTMDKTLSVTGDTTLKGTKVDGKLTVTDEADLKNTTVGGTLGVTGEATFKDKVTMEKDLEVKGELKTDKISMKNTDTDPDGTIHRSATTITADGITHNGEVEKSGVITKSQFTHTEEGSETYAKKGNTANWTETRSDVKADGVTTKVEDSKKNRTNTSQTADGIKGYATDKDGNKTYTKVTATENSFQVQDKDGKNKNHQVNTMGSSVTEIKNDEGKTTKTEQTAENITNTAKDGTIKNDAKDIVNNASGNISNKSQTMDTTVTGKATESYGSLDTTVNGNETHIVKGTKTETVDGKVTENYNAGQATKVTGNQDIHVTGKQTNTVEGGQENIISGGQINSITGDQTTTVTGDILNKAENITNEANTKLTDKVGDNTRVLDSEGITDTVPGADGKGSTFKQRIDAIMGNVKTDAGESEVTQKGDEITSVVGKGEATNSRVTQKKGSLEAGVTDGTNTNASYDVADASAKVLSGGTKVNKLQDNLDSSEKTITNGTYTTSKLQTALDITNTAKDGTITNDAKDIVNNASGNMTNTVGGDLTTTVSGNELHEVTGKQTNKIDGDQENTIGGNQTTIVTGDISNKAENITNEANTKLTDKVGDNTRVLDSEGITDTVGGSTFKQRIDKIMMESKDVSIKAEETLTNEAKVITNKASEVINNEAVNINNTATGIITSKASEIKNQADKLISNKVGENTWENMENGKITTSIKDGAKQNLTQSDAAGTTQSTVDGGKSTVTIQNADGLADAVTDGTNTSVQNQTASAIADAVKDGAGNENASVANATTSVNTIKSGSKANTVISTADGTSFINSEAAAPVGDGTEVKTTIKGNTITTGKVTMDYAEVMKDLGVRGNANIAGKTTTGSLEVKGESKLTGDVTMESNATVKKDLTVEGNTNLKNTKVDGTLDVTQKATFGDSVSIAKDLSVDGNATIKGDVTAKSYKVGDKTYISAAGINANDQKITNVADGSISEGSKDAVNGGQLYTVKNDFEGKVNKVGANAAAMANLHPMEFDPDSKWNIAAAIGNYGSETAAALGAFYRPNDDVMVNLSTAFGTGENMVGGGVSVRLGKGGNKLSREETNALKAQVDNLTARMDALLSVLNPNMSKDFPDVPENHWAYEAVSRLAGNDIVQGYPDGEFHGERTMTRYEMAEIIYNALSRGAEAEKELVEEFKPELQAMAASEKATAEKAEG